MVLHWLYEVLPCFYMVLPCFDMVLPCFTWFFGASWVLRSDFLEGFYCLCLRVFKNRLFFRVRDLFQ